MTYKKGYKNSVDCMLKTLKTIWKTVTDYIPIKAYTIPVVIENIGSTKHRVTANGIVLIFHLGRSIEYEAGFKELSCLQNQHIYQNCRHAYFALSLFILNILSITVWWVYTTELNWYILCIAMDSFYLSVQICHDKRLDTLFMQQTTPALVSYQPRLSKAFYHLQTLLYLHNSQLFSCWDIRGGGY